MTPIALALLGYAALQLLDKEEEDSGAWDDRHSISPVDAPSSPSVDWDFLNRPKPPPALQDKQRRPLPIEGAWAYGYLYIYITAAGGAGLYKNPLIQKYLADHDFTSSDILTFSTTTMSTYGAVRTATGSVPLLSDVIGAAAGLIHGFVDFASTVFDRDKQVRKMFEVWKEQFFGPLGRPPMALFHGLQTYEKELNTGGDTSLDPNLIGDLGNPYSPAIMLHVRLIKMWLTIAKHYKAPAKKDIKLAVHGKMNVKQRDGSILPVFIDYEGLERTEGLNLWAGNQALPFPYFFYAFDPRAMFDHVVTKQAMLPGQTEPTEWNLYSYIMSQKSKKDAFSFNAAEFSAVWPKGIAEWRLVVDPTKHTSSGISLPASDRERTLRTTKNGWFETRWEPS